MNDLTAPTIASGDAGPANSKQACYFLHNLIQDQYADALLELNDQGKVARALYHDQYANSSVVAVNWPQHLVQRLALHTQSPTELPEPECREEPLVRYLTKMPPLPINRDPPTRTRPLYH